MERRYRREGESRGMECERECYRSERDDERGYGVGEVVYRGYVSDTKNT